MTSAAAAQAANGDLQLVQLNFVKGQAYYQKALQLLPPSDKENRGQYLNGLGNSFQEAGVRTKGTDIQKFLREAATAYRDALTVYTKERFPQQWAMTQNNLGTVLGRQGTRTSGKAGIRLLAEAVTAHSEALTVHTKNQFPQQWAKSQYELGNVLRDQAIRTGGEAGKALIRQAIDAYELALQVWTMDTLSGAWEATTFNRMIAKEALENMK